MAEKVKALTCKVKKQTDEYTLYDILLEDGRKGTSFEEFEIGKEIEIEIEIKGQYTNFKTVKEKKAGKFGAPKDWAFEKRKAALELAIEATKLNGRTSTITKEILGTAKEFYNFLNTKNESIS